MDEPLKDAKLLTNFWPGKTGQYGKDQKYFDHTLMRYYPQVAQDIPDTSCEYNEIGAISAMAVIQGSRRIKETDLIRIASEFLEDHPEVDSIDGWIERPSLRNRQGPHKVVFYQKV